MGELTTTTQLTAGVPAASTEEATQYLTFYVAKERYAIAILDVKEIIEVADITRVPMTPDYIRGVLNLRGNVVPIVDLCARLGKTRCDLTKRSAIIMVDVESRQERQFIGMLVDEVHEILEIETTHLQPPPDFGTDIRTDFIQAMGRVEDVFIILLDINHVLSTEELSALRQATTSRADSGDLPKLSGAL